MKRLLFLICVLSTLFSFTALAQNGSWFQDGYGRWQYQYEDGSYAKEGWLQDASGRAFYFTGNNMQVGWVRVNEQYYYLDMTSGAMTTGWQLVKDKWYYMAPTGVMQTGWQFVNDKWYYMYPNGEMAMGWLQSPNGWYWMNNPNGDMAVKSWVADGQYYVGADGLMLTNTTIDGKRLQSDGKVKWDYQVEKFKVENRMFTDEEFRTMADDCYSNYYEVLAEVSERVMSYHDEYYDDYNTSDEDWEYPELSFSDTLTKAACQRSCENASKQIMASTRPNGQNYDTVLADYSVKYDYSAESVAFGQRDADALFEALEKSSGQMQYMRNKNFTQFGVGLAYDDENEPYWTILYSGTRAE